MTLPAIKYEADGGYQTLALVLLRLASGYSSDKNAQPKPEETLHNLDLCDEIRSVLNADDLPDQACAIIAVLFEQYVAKRKPMDAMDVLIQIYGTPGNALDGLVHIKRLVDLDLVQIEAQTPWEIDIGKPASGVDRLSSLIKSSLALTDDFVDTVLIEYDLPSEPLKPYSSNKEYVRDWLAYAQSACADGTATLSDSERVPSHFKSQSYSDHLYSRIVDRKAISSCALHFDKMATEFSLERRELVALLVLFKRDMDRSPTSQVEFIQQLTNDPLERAQLFLDLIDCSKLVAEGLIETEEATYGRSARIRLTRKARDRILGHDGTHRASKPEHIARRSGLFEAVCPTQTLDDVILPDEIKKRIVIAVRRYEKNVDATLREWGIDPPLPEDQKSTSCEAPLRILLSGASGTGKTYAAGAIARSLSKTMLVTDISQLLSKWIGESEKQVRELFKVYEEIVSQSDNPPVLLLNECDQFLQRRLAPDHATDRMYNQMQALFLEGLEKMHGVLIATTNLADQLDEAYSRRFHLKLEFPIPGPTERKALWKKHLLPTIPQVDDIDLDFLANNYELTGGQITVVVRNAAIEAAVEGQPLLMFHLERAARTDIVATTTRNQVFQNNIGFRPTNRD